MACFILLEKQVPPIEIIERLDLADGDFTEDECGMFLSVPKLFTLDMTEQRKVVGKAIKTPVLILDDMGVELSSSDWQFLLLYAIINERYHNEDPTIMTSNLSIGQLAKKIKDPRIVSRLKASYKMINIMEEDRRVMK